MIRTTIVQSQFSPWFLRWWNVRYKFLLLSFLDDNSVLSVFQSGFRKKHSTETAVVYLVDHILEHMYKQQLTGAAFIDLKKAFDLVDHRCLLHKLQHYGVRGRSLNLFKHYLTTRSQRVQYGKELSSSLPIYRLRRSARFTPDLLFAQWHLLQFAIIFPVNARFLIFITITPEVPTGSALEQ